LNDTLPYRADPPHPETRNLEPRISKPETLNPEFWNPKPETLAGLIHHIATHGGRAAWENPVLQGAIKLTGSRLLYLPGVPSSVCVYININI